MMIDGTIKLADFGLTKELTEYITCAHTTVGTKNYMAPEVFAGKRYA